MAALSEMPNQAGNENAVGAKTRAAPNRFYLVMDTLDGLPQTGGTGIYLKQQIEDKLTDHNQSINEHGREAPVLAPIMIVVAANGPTVGLY